MAGILFIRSYCRIKPTEPAVECSIRSTTATTLATITEVLADAYQRQQPVTIQLKTVDQNNRHLPDITTLIHGYNANDIVIDADRFIPLQEIRNVSFKNTEKL